jgi:TonB family protein
MFSIALAAAAQVSTAPPGRGDVRTLFAATDYPAKALARGEEGEVVADLLISPSGRVETCSIALSSGFSDLDQATCVLLQTRARFIPGKDDAGHPRYDVFRTPPVTWSVGSFRSFRVPPDYDLTINRAPDGVQLPLEFKIDYLVTPAGTPRNCAVSPDKSAPTELVALACQTVVSAPAHIIRDHNGLPVEAQNHASFRFSLDKH